MQVTAVFAWQVPFSSFPGLYDRAELEQAGKSFLIEKLSAVAPSPKVPLLPLVAEGDPAEALITAAKDANLLVLGTSGRSRLAGFLLGSVSSRCAAAAPCPVLLVKAQQAARPGTVPPGSFARDWGTSVSWAMSYTILGECLIS